MTTATARYDRITFTCGQLVVTSQLHYARDPHEPHSITYPEWNVKISAPNNVSIHMKWSGKRAYRPEHAPLWLGLCSLGFVVAPWGRGSRAGAWPVPGAPPERYVASDLVREYGNVDYHLIHEGSEDPDPREEVLVVFDILGAALAPQLTTALWWSLSPLKDDKLMVDWLDWRSGARLGALPCWNEKFDTVGRWAATVTSQDWRWGSGNFNLEVGR